MRSQRGLWTTMLLLTTLLTTHATDETNESYKTINGRPGTTIDDRNILTYRKILANSEGRATDVNTPTIKENESATQSLNEQKNDDYFKVNSTHGSERENAEATADDGSDKNRNASRNSKETGTDLRQQRNDDKEITSDDLDQSRNRTNGTNDSNREQKIFGINNNLGFVEEIHVFHEEGENEEIVVEIIDEDTDDDKARVTHIHLEEKELDNAVEFGMQSVEDLIRVKEPLWYNMGLFLDKADPASKVAAFGKPINDFALEVSKYGFLTLEASKKMAESFPENVSRQAAGFPGSFHPRQLRDGCPLKGTPRCPPASRRYRTADGTCNNLDNPWKGSAMLPMQRFLPPAYEDGIQSIRRSILGPRLPSAREVSVQIHGDRDKELPTVTLMLMQWGQFIDHDVTSVVKSRSFNGSIPRCCDRGGRAVLPQEFMHPACLPIEVPIDDWFLGTFGVRCMEFIRSAPSTRVNCDLGWREQINQVTAFIDASTIYGSDIETSDSMRTFRNGRIIYGRSRRQGPLQPPDPPGGELCRSGALTTDCFHSGDGRVSEQPGLTAMHTIWVRFHNKVTTVLSKFNPHWSDEKLYQETRKIVYALVQHITYREFLPIVLGPEVMDLFELRLVRKGYYTQYDSKVNPTIANSFSTAAYRFGHSMVQNSFVRTDHKHRPLFNNVSLHEELNNFENIWSFGSVDRLLLGFANQPAQRRDEFICDELSNHLFQSPNSPFGLDLAAINIQRGRDHGIPSYTSWREPCGLSPIKTWQDLKGIFNPNSIDRFRSVYHHVDDIDLFSGGLAEKPVRGGVVGPTFACIIAQQFLNLRKGDRFWYENGGFDSSFTPAQLQQIRHVTLAQILCYTTDEIETIQPFVFLSPDTFRNVRLSCSSPLIDNFDLSAWEEREFNEFDGINNNIDFKRELKFPLRRTKRSKTKTTTKRPKTKNRTKTSTKRKTANSGFRVRITNVTTSSVKLGDNYGGGSGVTANTVPPRPVYRPQSYQSDKDNTEVTYLTGVVPTKTPQKPPLEVNIKIQYYLPTTQTTTTTRPTRKKKKNPTRKPTYSQTVVITQRPPNKNPQISYPSIVQGYNDFAVRPNDLFEKPTNVPRPINIDNKPGYTFTDTKRPIHVYDKPTIVEDNYDNYRPSNRPGIYTYNEPTTKKPYSARPQTSYQNSYDQTVYEDLPFSTSQRPYYYDTYPTRRPSFRPQQNGYNDEIYDNIKRPNNYDKPQQNGHDDEIYYFNKRPSNYDKPQQNGYNSEIYDYNKRPSSYDKFDPINDVYEQVFNEHDRIGDVPKKPTFGQSDFTDSTRFPDRVNKPTKIYSIAHIHKLDNDQIDDKLDFKTRLVTKPKGYDEYDDRRFIKISSVKAGMTLTDKDLESYTLQERDGEMDLKELGGKEDKIKVVDIAVAPSEIEDDQWLVYNATDEIMPMLLVPDINKNISCSSELPRPMKRPKASQKLNIKDSRTL
ncbi:uncharacterized protein LOC108913999 [Anoplophora glabripennis]|uniref:uncharacterized protein LOC108913999 n=1 Tax=Anoplophora glabripennis TaxID=217634 RepID=UPI0008739C75|nr:uncharacterized protein LOC108913999 [Anoplophora glabripennis]